MTKENYFIKEGYQNHKVDDATLNQIRLNYWNEERIDLSKYYQYHVYQYAKKIIKKCKIENVLDIGCGVATKLIEIIFPDCKNITGIDGLGALEYCKRNFDYGNFIVDDLEYPLSNPGKFDLIICADVIEHLQNPNNLIEFIKKCSHQNSLIIISTPERDILRGKNCMESTKPEHIREWNRYELRKYLEFSGLGIISHKIIPFIKITPRIKILKILLTNLFSVKTIRTTQMVICKINAS